MSEIAMQTAEMIGMLPEDEVLIVNALLKKLLQAWDPDFTKVTPSEMERINEADEELKNGIFFSTEDVFS